MDIHILVVEDEITVNNNISEFIHDLGNPFHLVGSAANGLQAIDYFKKNHVHILLTDIRMPQMDGIELIEHVNHHWPETKTIILSGYNDFKYAQKAIQYGAIDYLLKPLKKEELISRLVKVASSLYDDTNAYSTLMINQEKWDMTMIRMESELFDHVEVGNVQGAQEATSRLLDAFRRKVGDNRLRVIPFIIDSLLALNKRLASVGTGTIFYFFRTADSGFKDRQSHRIHYDRIEFERDESCFEESQFASIGKDYTGR